MQVRDGCLNPKGYQQFTAGQIDAAQALTVPDGARYALIKCEAVSIRWLDHGPNPTTTVGQLVDIGDEFMYSGQLKQLRVIGTAINAILNVTYYQ